MKIRSKLILFTSFYSVSILVLLLITFSFFSIRTRENEVINMTESNLEILSDMLEHELHHYVSIVETIASNKGIEDSLEVSNIEYDLLDESTRNNQIDSLNQTWINSADEDPFISDILSNDLSILLKDIVESEVGYYGEIFVTNKYGLMIGSSGRLTTMYHGEKYWWTGAYNDDNPQIYFDDRGYDTSVGSVVLGVVMPIYYDGEFNGIIKVNIIITEMINEHLINLNSLTEDGEYFVTRQNGLIVSGENIEPLSQNIDDDIIDYFSNGDFIDVVEVNNSDHYLGIKDLNFDNFDEEIFFGGNQISSSDHSLGSEVGVWKVIFVSNATALNQSSISTIYLTVLVGLIIIVVMVPVFIISGNGLMNRIKLLILSTEELTKGNYGGNVKAMSNDEITELTVDLNKLSQTLKDNTTSIEKYKLALQKSEELEMKLLETSRMDELTQIHNRRGFNDFFAKYNANANREGTCIGFILFDIDDFKLVNDTYGHDKGDLVLKTLAEGVKEVLREGDILCRWGGEEFVVLIPSSNEKDIEVISEKVRLTCQNIDLELQSNITVSVGATISCKLDSLDTIIKRADNGLYTSKKTGKNKVTVVLK